MSRDLYVWGPGLEHQTSATLPAGAVLPGPAATSVATSYGRRLDQLPRSTFSPTSLRYRRQRRRPLDPTTGDDRPLYFVNACFLTASTLLGVAGPAADRRSRDLRVGKVQRDAWIWLATCERCPEIRTGHRRDDVVRALCAHYAPVHVTVQHLPEWR